MFKWKFSLFINQYTAISRKVVGKKNIKVHATRPKGGLGIQWNFAYWPGGNLQVCILHVENVFPFRRPISVALLLLSHAFESGKILLNFRGSKRSLFLHV